MSESFINPFYTFCVCRVSTYVRTLRKVTFAGCVSVPLGAV